MGQRTTLKAVQDLLTSNYGPLPTTLGGGNPDLQPFIDSAWPTVDRILSLASEQHKTVPTDAEAEIIERWLAAYKYTLSDPLYASKTTAGKSGSFVQGGQSLDGEQNRMKRGAIELDPSGILNSLLNRKSAHLYAW